MSEAKRLHRRDPERVEPIRHRPAAPRSAHYAPSDESLFLDPEISAWSGRGREGAWSEADLEQRSETPDPRDAEGTEPWQASVAHGVDLGYRIAEEHIRQAQRATSSFGPDAWGRTQAPGGGRGEVVKDVSELFLRTLRYSEEMVGMFLDVVRSSTGRAETWRSRPPHAPGFGDRVGGPRSSDGWPWSSEGPSDSSWNGDERAPRPPFGGEWGSPRSADPAAAWSAPDAIRETPRDSALAVAFDVSSSRPIRLLLDLADCPPGTSLGSHGLRSVQAEKPPLESLTIDIETDRCRVQLDIPDDHPEGLYSGIVLDLESGKPLGTLSVTIDATDLNEPEAG